MDGKSSAKSIINNGIMEIIKFKTNNSFTINKKYGITLPIAS
jgi:hypothetical protein